MATSLPAAPQSDFQVDATPEQVAFFQQNGFVQIERITTDEELAWLVTIYDELFAERRGAFKGGYFDLSRPYDADGEDLLPQVLMPEVRHPELRTTTYVRNGRRIAAALLGVAEEQLQQWGHMILKPPRRGHETPWHQDESYWEPDLSYTAVGAWMPLEGATVESGCLHFVPGSHRGDLLPHRHINDDPSVHGLFTDQADTSTAVPVPLAPGGATFHHPRTLHYAGPNTTDRPRRAYANEFQLPPVKRAVPQDKPWFHEGREAWDARPILRTDRTGGTKGE